MATEATLPKNVTRWKDRHGKIRYRFRKTGQPTYYFRSRPGTEEFQDELLILRAGEVLPPRVSRRVLLLERQIEAISQELRLLRSGESRPSAPRPTKVYFIGASLGPIKIGLSAHPRKRLRDLRTTHHGRLRLITAVDGGRELEAEYHRRFAEHRLNGEWFARHPDVLAEIERLKG